MGLPGTAGLLQLFLPVWHTRIVGLARPVPTFTSNDSHQNGTQELLRYFLPRAEKKVPGLPGSSTSIQTFDDI